MNDHLGGVLLHGGGAWFRFSTQKGNASVFFGKTALQKAFERMKIFFAFVLFFSFAIASHVIFLFNFIL